MTESKRAARLRAELDDGSNAGALGDLIAVWAGLADALWLGTMRAVLDPEPPAKLPYPAPRLVGVPADRAQRERAA